MDKNTAQMLDKETAERYFNELTWGKSKVEFLHDYFNVSKHFANKVLGALGEYSWDYFSSTSPYDYSEMSALAYKVGIMSAQIKELQKEVEALKN